MKKNYSILFAILCFLAFQIPSVQGQAAFGFNVNVASPKGELSNNIKHPAGISFDVLIPIKKIRGLYVGGEFGVSMYANDSYLLSNADETDVFEVDEEDCFLAYHATAKYFPLKKRGLFNPYLEAKVGGLSYFSTIMSDEEDFDSQTSFHGSAFNAGLGGGLVIKAFRNLSFNSSVIYSVGSRANYRMIDKKDEVKKGLNEGIKNAETNYINFKLGILFGF